MKARRNLRLVALAYPIGLLFFVGLGDPAGLINLPVLFALKDKWQAGPQAVALFEALVMIPAYAAVLFGLLRDHWSPFGRRGWFGQRDRAYLVVAAPLAALGYLWLVEASTSYLPLLIGVMGVMVAYQMLEVSCWAMVTTAGQRASATGNLSALWEVVETLVRIVSVLAGGWLAAHAALEVSFMLAALLTLPVFALAFVGPRVKETPAPVDAVRGDVEASEADWRQLWRRLRERGEPLWPVAAVLFLHSFSPGWGTPLLYYLTDTVHLSSDAFGLCRAAQHGGVLVAAGLYVVLHRKLPFDRLLMLVVAVNVLPAFGYLLIRDTAEAIVVCAVIGLLCGLSSVAVFDLLMRSCPRGLEGAGTAAGYSAIGLASALGDVAGATLYAHGGFVACLVVDAVATAAILPLLPRLRQLRPPSTAATA